MDEIDKLIESMLKGDAPTQKLRRAVERLQHAMDLSAEIIGDTEQLTACCERFRRDFYEN